MKTLEDCINLGENYVKLEEFRTKVCARLIKTGDQREHQISAKEVLFQCGEIKGETFAAIQDAPGMRKI
jgi:DNA-binding SARP family transcriptional activator